MTFALIDGMFRLRHTVFRERLGWEVASKDSREQDEFDDCDPMYVIAHAARAIEDHSGDTIVALSSAGLERMIRRHVPTTRLDGGQCTQIGTLRCAAFTCSTTAWLTTTPALDTGIEIYR